ncbi:MAG TPA: twin-arginine translocase TatA/TatE family subunit [bacterium]|nr:twin-arginine translocase TatA/TatE family subunit [bacterium]HOH08420.1 twin-arginine translocase TatA/TatE family subunit [bacterium]
MGVGPTEWVIIILILVLLFGAKKIPELARGMGQGLREFKKAANEVQDTSSQSASRGEVGPKENKQE